MFTNFCLEDLCCHRVSFEIGPYSLCLAFCYFISMCLILIFVHLQVVAGMSVMLDVFVLDINVALNLTWKGLGIVLMTLAGWFDLVLGSDVTM